MKISILERRPSANPRLAGIGIEVSPVCVDDLDIGMVIWGVGDIDYGMLEDDSDGLKRTPAVHPGRKPRPYIRFGGQVPQPIDGGWEGIVQAIKDELDSDYRADFVASLLRTRPSAYINGFLCAMESSLTESDCSATAIRVAMRRLGCVKGTH